MNIQEIAKLAEVSVSTVSKVMNGKDKDISEKTRKKILKIVEDNGYIPYAKYRVKEGLFRRFIGLIIDRDNPYYREIILSAETLLKKRGFFLVTYTTEHGDNKEKAFNELRKRGVSGVLIDSCHAIAESTEECKVVYFTHTGKFENGQKNTFYYRKYDAGRLAAKALFEMGHQRISCLLRDTEKTVLEGIEAVSREWNHPKEFVTSYIIEEKSEEHLWENALELCVADISTAVVCSDADIVSSVIEYAKQIGMEIPKECSVICMKDHEILEHLAGGITAINYPIDQMIEDAALHLLKMITDRQESEVYRKIFPVLKKRKSIWNVFEKSSEKKIVVVGSMNMDNSIESVLTPVNGETTIATNILMMPGGKGANQAVGVGRLGGESYMIGKIGKDADGRKIYKSLTDNGVHTEGVEFDEHFGNHSQSRWKGMLLHNRFHVCFCYGYGNDSILRTGNPEYSRGNYKNHQQRWRQSYVGIDRNCNSNCLYSVSMQWSAKRNKMDLQCKHDFFADIIDDCICCRTNNLYYSAVTGIFWNICG